MKATRVFQAVLTVALLALVAASAMAQPPAAGGPGGGGGRGQGMGMAMLYIERTWSTVCFELAPTVEQYMKLVPAFQANWDARRAAMAKARETRDPQVAATALETTQKDIEAKLKEILTAEQFTKWDQLKAQQQQGGRGGRGGRGGGAGGAGGGQGQPPAPPQ